jgi:hypothetical protein
MRMPSVPDIPGKGLVRETTKGVRMLVVGVGAGVLAGGGFLLKRALGRWSGSGEGVDADPIAETPTAPPGAEKKPVPKPSIVKPKAAKPKVVKPAPAKPKAAKPKPPKLEVKPDPASKPKPPEAKAAKKPPKTTGTDAPPKPEFEPGNISGDKNPHRALNNPVGDPDETEYPDPFEKREDPRDPTDPDGLPFGEDPHPPTGSASTSEPRPADDLEAGDRAMPPQREKLDE